MKKSRDTSEVFPFFPFPNLVVKPLFFLFLFLFQRVQPIKTLSHRHCDTGSTRPVSKVPKGANPLIQYTENLSNGKAKEQKNVTRTFCDY